MKYAFQMHRNRRVIKDSKCLKALELSRAAMVTRPKKSYQVCSPRQMFKVKTGKKNLHSTTRHLCWWGANGGKECSRCFNFSSRYLYVLKKPLWQKQGQFAIRCYLRKQQQIMSVTDRITSYSLYCTVTKNNAPEEEKQISPHREHPEAQTSSINILPLYFLKKYSLGISLRET